MKNNILISTLIAVMVSIVMMYVAWKYNSQGEIHSEIGIDFTYWLLLGMSWFVMVFLLVLILLLIAKKMWKYFNGKG